MKGIDVSNYQAGIDFSKFNPDFVLIKATEGKTLVDKSVENHLKGALDCGALVGFYHFARPDINKSTLGMRKEAIHFVNQIEKLGMVKKAIMVLDWEVGPIDVSGFAQEWVYTVKEMTGVTPFIYGNSNDILNKPMMSVTKELPVWFAYWPLGYQVAWEETESLVDSNYDKVKKKTKDVFLRIWQFTNRGTVPGWHGVVDLDYSRMTKRDWITAAGGIYEETLSEDMKWAIEMGIIRGFKDGTFRPDNNVTRSQLATVLHRFWDLMMKEKEK